MVTIPTPTYDPTSQGNKPGDGPLRVGGQSVASLTPNDKSGLPSTHNHQRARQERGLVLVRDLWAGAERIRDAAQTYLPQAPAEDGINYRNRLERSVFHGFYRRAVEGLVGLIYRTDPVLGEDVPEIIREHWENLDLAGTHGDVFLRDITQDALCVGHAGILVDYPDTGGQVLTRAEEAPLRPYWVPVRKDDIMSWRTVNVDGGIKLVQLVIRECSYAPVGEFGEAEITRYRVLYVDALGAVRWKLLWEHPDKRTVSVLAEGSYPTQTDIPFAASYTNGKVGYLDSDPPLLDMAYLNLAHYQQWSDYAYATHMSNVPFLFFAGVPKDKGEKIVIGANTSFTAQDPGAHAEYVSHDGASLAASRQALEDLKSDMGTLGIAMLAPQKRVAETAEGKRLDKSTSDSALSTLARSVQDAVEQCLIYHANYLRLPQGGSITINRDYEGLLMDANVMGAYTQLVEAGFPARVVLKALKAGGRIPDDEDIETLEMEMLAGFAAKQEAAEEMRDQFQSAREEAV